MDGLLHDPVIMLWLLNSPVWEADRRERLITFKFSRFSYSERDANTPAHVRIILSQ